MLRASFLPTLLLLSIASQALAGPELGDDVATCRERPSDPKQNDPKVRIDACERVIASGQASAKDLAVALATRGEALLAKRDYDKAIAAFSDALKADPDNVRILDGRGIAYGRKGEDDLAMGDYNLAFSSNDRFRLHGMNGRQIHRLLARMIDYIETESSVASRYAEYPQRGRKGYEIEHIWADHPERHKEEFAHPSDFQEYRNRIGGLLLLPKSFNASYGDLRYAEKREHYLGQGGNLLARSLHERAYDHNPGFKRFIQESRLPFRPHSEFKKADLDARQQLYQELAEQIWNPDRIAKEAAE
jgi:hypothetical protein